MEGLIQKVPAYKVGQVFASTLVDAQKEALSQLLATEASLNDVGVRSSVEVLLKRADDIIAILSPPKELRSRKPRKDAGQPRSKKVKSEPACPIA